MQYVSIDDPAFGAIPNSNAPGVAATNAAAFALAFAASPEVFIPDSLTYYCQELLPPPSARRLFGRGSLIAGGTIAGGQALVFVSANVVGFTIEDVSIRVDPLVFPAVSGVLLSSCNKSTVKNLNVSGCQFGIFISGGDNNRVIDNSVVDYGTFGIFAATNASNLVIEGNCLSGTLAASAHAIVVQNVIFFRVQSNMVSQSKGGGIWLPLSAYGSVTGNVVINSTFEAIHTDSSANIVISGNTLSWSANSVEVGISISSDNGSPALYINITGNIVNSPACAGIYLVGAQRCIVSGNLIYNCNQSKASGAAGAAILLDGTTVSTLQNSIMSNFMMSSDLNMRYGVAERTAGANTPGDTYVGNNYYKNPSIAETLLIGAGSVAGITQSLAVRNSAGTGVSTLTIKGGIITAMM